MYCGVSVSRIYNLVIRCRYFVNFMPRYVLDTNLCGSVPQPVYRRCVQHKAGAPWRNLVPDVLPPLPSHWTEWLGTSEVYPDNAFFCSSFNILTDEYASSIGNALTCIYYTGCAVLISVKTPIILTGFCCLSRWHSTDFGLATTASFHIYLFIFQLRTAAFKAYCAILARRSNFRHLASPRVSPREST
jgi:hypothetical protein